MTERRSAKEKIESTPDVARLEAGWYRGRCGEMNSCVLYREETRVSLRSPDAADRSLIHTHPTFLLLLDDSGAYPSMRDVEGFLRAVKDSNLRSFHIARVDRSGEVVGYTTVRATQRLAELVGCGGESVEALYGIVQHVELGDCSHKTAVVDILARFGGFGLQFRATPMPGYRFEDGEFVRK